MDDIDQLNRPSFIEEWAWIGLWDDPKSWKGVMGSDSNSWRWSATGSTSTTGYHNLVTDFRFARETCVFTDISGQWLDAGCSVIYYFICYTGKETFFSYLAMIENEEENRNVTTVRRGHEAWIGLYRGPWMWSDGSNSFFRNWISWALDNQYNRQHCVTDHPDHRWDDQDCSVQGHFICQGGKTNLNSLRNLSDC
uniref:C-type lectin domain-containing protein n=1 Tax=Salarias fasciatus TaxID=181472 RepID=A0A672IJ95_SALFA